MDFGFTNNENEIERVRKWRNDAIADGWSHKPTYGDGEEEDRACSLEKDGWKALILTRINDTKRHKFSFEAEVSVWGPDGLSINPSPVYNFDLMKQDIRTCHSCNKINIETFRFSFAGRCCKECLPEMRRKHEYPGWCD